MNPRDPNPASVRHPRRAASAPIAGSVCPSPRRLTPGFLAACATFGAISDAAATADTNASSHEVLLQAPMGGLAEVPTNQVPANLLPPPGIGVNKQVPDLEHGTPLPPAVMDRVKQANVGQDRFTWFASQPVPLMPYLASQDLLGNTAIKPGPLISTTPLDGAVQQAKYQISEAGLRYSLKQTFTGVGMSDVLQGASALGFYTLSFGGKWAIYNAPADGMAGWLSLEFKAKTGLGAAGQTQDARTNLGSATDPTSIWSKVNGVRLPELAWQQSFRHGEIVVVAGMVDQSNYLDGNSYANTGRGQFMNSALINSMVVPLPAYNFGVNLQWQPSEDWYAVLGNSVGNGTPGSQPWNDFSWNNWSLIGEFGLTPKNVLGLGPGVYRIQPFIGQVGGAPAKVGMGLNFQQQLGMDAPFGWYGRFARGGRERRAIFGGEEPVDSDQPQLGPGYQVGTGFVVKGPLALAGVLVDRNSDAAGIGFVVSHPTSTATPAYHDNEFVLETGYVLQLTPTAKLQPDLQLVWNPIHSPISGPAAVVQLQLDVAW